MAGPPWIGPSEVATMRSSAVWSVVQREATEGRESRARPDSRILVGQAPPTVDAKYLTSFDGSIYRLGDANHDGSWGGAGELKVPIVQNVPAGDHNLDNLQIVGNTLYVGVGDRT